VTLRDPAWKAYICSMRSCLSGSTEAIVPHHVRLAGFCGTGQKPADYFCVPVTYAEHSRIHTSGYGPGEREIVLDQLVRLLVEYMERDDRF
jgi:hypothetical protein